MKTIIACVAVLGVSVVLGSVKPRRTYGSFNPSAERVPRRADEGVPYEIGEFIKADEEAQKKRFDKLPIEERSRQLRKEMEALVGRERVQEAVRKHEEERRK